MAASQSLSPVSPKPKTSALSVALNKALGGGIPGAMAMVLQVLLLMWLRTTINYQYRHGGTIKEAFAELYSQGGIPRFYQGVGPALFQGPLSRFGDTAANEGIKSLLSGTSYPVSVVTFIASLTAAAWRIFITPVDTLKTFLQVDGAAGLATLSNKIQKYGILSLYDGWAGTYMATLVGHYPWFVTFNSLDKWVPKAEGGILRLVRRALIGFCASLNSDIISNSFRVVKTYVQTSATPIGYFAAVMEIVGADGWSGLFVRGLGVKIISNGISAMLFTVLWKYFMEVMERRTAQKESGKTK